MMALTDLSPAQFRLLARADRRGTPVDNVRLLAEQCRASRTDLDGLQQRGFVRFTSKANGRLSNVTATDDSELNDLTMELSSPGRRFVASQIRRQYAAMKVLAAGSHSGLRARQLAKQADATRDTVAMLLDGRLVTVRSVLGRDLDASQVGAGPIVRTDQWTVRLTNTGIDHL